MTKEDIIRMAREAGWTIGPATLSGLERFAALVAAAATEAANARANTSWALMCKKMVAAENEACAKVCESTLWSCDIDWWRQATKREVGEKSALECAAAIRARGQA